MKKKRLAMVVYSNYPQDPRVRREAEAVAEEGYPVDIFCLVYHDQPRKERYGNITVYRSAISRSRAGKLMYIFEYALFILAMTLKVFAHFLIKWYRLVHVHNMPDILVVSALLPKLFGAKVILDLHDPIPEVYMTKYGIDESHRMIKVLLAMEKRSIGWADRVLTPNLAFRSLFVSRGNPAEKIEIIMNTPLETLFLDCPCEPRYDPGEDLKIIYHGSIVVRHGLTDALDAVEILLPEMPGLRFDIYGGGDFVQGLQEEISDRGLSRNVVFHGFMDQDALVHEIVKADLGIIPNRRTPFTEVNLPTRIFEYLCLGKPVIVPETRGIADYFDAESLLYFESGNARDLANRIGAAYKDPHGVRETIRRGVEVYRRHTWSGQRQRLIEIVSGLLD